MPGRSRARGRRSITPWSIALPAKAVVPERKLLTEAMKRGLGVVTVEGVQRELAGRPLIRGEHGGRESRRHDGGDAWPRSRGIVAFAREGRGRFRPLGDPDRPFTREWLNDGQKAAVRHVLGSRDRVTMIRGAAGTGKTTLEQELGEALAEAGRRWWSLAPRGQGEPSTCCARSGLRRGRHRGPVLQGPARCRSGARRRGVWSMRPGCSAARTCCGCSTWPASSTPGSCWSGDRRQHRSVAAGEPLKLLEERAGLPVAEVTEIMRQVGRLPQGGRGVERRQGRRGVRRAGQARLDQGVPACRPLLGSWPQAYLAAVDEKNTDGERQAALVVSPTHAEAARITGAIRDALKADGQARRGADACRLGAGPPDRCPEKPTRPTTSRATCSSSTRTRPATRSGSRLVVAEGRSCRWNMPTASRCTGRRSYRWPWATASASPPAARPRTASTGLPTARSSPCRALPGRAIVIVDHGWVIGRDLGHLAQGYAVTSHASQGKTVDKVFIGQSSQSFPATNQRQFYVSVVTRQGAGGGLHRRQERVAQGRAAARRAAVGDGVGGVAAGQAAAAAAP